MLGTGAPEAPEEAWFHQPVTKGSTLLFVVQSEGDRGF